MLLHRNDCSSLNTGLHLSFRVRVRVRVRVDPTPYPRQVEGARRLQYVSAEVQNAVAKAPACTASPNETDTHEICDM